ncbi:hypothetical protein KUCAC02_001247, partial [Chaenocephalus aceratus]
LLLLTLACQCFTFDEESDALGNEGLTHLDRLKGSIAVRAGDTFSPIVPFPMVSINLVGLATTYSSSLSLLGHPLQYVQGAHDLRTLSNCAKWRRAAIAEASFSFHFLLDKCFIVPQILSQPKRRSASIALLNFHPSSWLISPVVSPVEHGRKRALSPRPGVEMKVSYFASQAASHLLHGRERQPLYFTSGLGVRHHCPLISCRGSQPDRHENTLQDVSWAAVTSVSVEGICTSHRIS